MRRSRPHASSFRATPWRVVLVLATAFGVALIGRLVYAGELSPAAAAPDTNLAINRPATGSTPCNGEEGPAKAVNGSVSGGDSDKFCSAAEAKFLQVDLGSAISIGSFTVRHAQAGGQSASWTAPSASSPFSCFPFPTSDPALPQHPKVVLAAGVPPLPQNVQDLAHRYYDIEWPSIWQNFGDPDRLHSTDSGLVQVIIEPGTAAWSSSAVMHIGYDNLVAVANDSGGTGYWTHEHGHMTQNYSGAPEIFKEGIPDFIRFVAHGEDPGWKIADLSNTFPDFFEEQTVWDQGSAKAARFMAWLTMRYDDSGNRYQLVHDLNTALNHGEQDYAGLFVKRTGKSYHQLFAEYQDDRAIPPHC